MNDTDKKEITEHIDRALIVGKADSSNLAGHILNKIDEGVGKAVQKYVNGYLQEVIENLKRQDVVLEKIQIEQERVRNELVKFHTDTDPIIEAKKTLTIGGKATLWLAGAIVAIGSAIVTIKALFK